MAFTLTVEGGDGVGKSSLVASLIRGLEEGLAARRLPSYSVYLKEHQDHKYSPDFFSSPEAFYLDQIKFAENSLYYILIREPEKTGVEGELRQIFLERWYAKYLGEGVYPKLYNASRVITYKAVLPAARVVPNLVIVADRSGLTTETMQLVDFVRGTLRSLKARFRIEESESELESTLTQLVTIIGEENILRNKVTFHEFARLVVIPAAEPILRNLLGDEVFKKLNDKGRIWLSEVSSELKTERRVICRNNENLYGVKYPANFVIADVPYPFEISQARNLARYCFGGLRNFRDQDPWWVVDWIAQLYREAPKSFEGTNSKWMNVYCPPEVAQRKLLKTFSEMLYSSGDKAATRLMNAGLETTQELIEYMWSHMSTEVAEVEIPVDLEAKIRFALRKIGRTTDTELSRLAQIARKGGPTQLSEALLVLQGIPNWQRAEGDMGKVWAEHEISSEGVLIGRGVEGQVLGRGPEM
jgi:hypothetical protein